jgi:hypothetical protein
MVFVLVGSTSEGFETFLRSGTLPTPDIEGANGEQQIIIKPFISLMTKDKAEGRSSPTPGPSRPTDKGKGKEPAADNSPTPGLSRPTDKGKGKETAAGNTPEQAGILDVGGAGSEDSAGVRGELGGPGIEHSAGPEAGVGDQLGGDDMDASAKAAALLAQLRSTLRTQQSGEFSCKPTSHTVTD